jgi:acetyl-CoA acetyltransferase
MLAQAHMAAFGTTERHLAMVSVKNHHYGSLNPHAHMQKEVTLEKALSSFMVAYPLKLYDCSLITDGSASVMLASEEKAREITPKPVWLIGLGLATDTMTLGERKTLTALRASEVAARAAYEMAGVGPSDVDVATVHDCFTIAEILAYEDLGFCQKGDGWKLIEEGVTHLDGRTPVNMDGGLKSKGHPIGATGVSMAVEITRQLRGEADTHQVRDADIGLTHNVGGSGQIVAVHIFKRD